VRVRRAGQLRVRPEQAREDEQDTGHPATS
jgi:hypothetical protein